MPYLPPASGAGPSDPYERVRRHAGGSATDELRALRDEMRDSLGAPSSVEGFFQRNGKGVAMVVGAIATAITAVYGAVKPEKVAQRTAGETATILENLQTVVTGNAAAIDRMRVHLEEGLVQNSAECKAQVSAVKTLVTGYMFASPKAGGGTVRTALNKLVDTLSHDQAQAQAAAERVKAPEVVTSVERVRETVGGNSLDALKQIQKGD